MSTCDHPLAAELPEDAYLTLRWIRWDEEDGQVCSLGEMSTRQFLRLLVPEATVFIEEFGAMRGEAWVGVEGTAGIVTVGQLLDLLHDDELQLVDFEALVDGWLRVSTHDDGEVHLAAERGGDVRPHVLKALSSRGVAGERILEQAEANRGSYLALSPPDTVLAVYPTFENYLAATR